MYIDFKELDANGIHLELLVQELMLLEGLDVHWEGVGPDNKKDLVVLESVNGILGSYQHKWVVQCKHTAHSGKSFGNKENLNIRDTCDMVGADGFLLVCTTYLSAQLIEKLDAIARQYKMQVKYWDAIELEKRLLKPACFPLIERFFPKSSKRIGCKVYSSTEPSKWLATYKEHLFALSCRLSNYYPSIGNVERLIGIVDAFYSQYNQEKEVFYRDEIDEYHMTIDYLAEQDTLDPSYFSADLKSRLMNTNDYEFLRVRSIWYDDIYGSFRVNVDYLYDGAAPLISLADFKTYFGAHNSVTDDSREYCVIWEFGLYKGSFDHDHFNPNHSEYYTDMNSSIPKNKSMLSYRMEFSIYGDDLMSMNSFDDILGLDATDLPF